MAPVLMPHLTAVIGLLKELFPSAAVMLTKSSVPDGRATSPAAEVDDFGDDAFTGRC